MYAVIQTGGKQYRVFPGEVVRIEKLEKEAGDSVVFDKVLLVCKDDESYAVGTPVVSGASVEGTVVRQGKAKKVIAFKKKRRKDFSKWIGHRQPFTEVKIGEIKA